jgi:hypothetical protein
MYVRTWASVEKNHKIVSLSYLAVEQSKVVCAGKVAFLDLGYRGRGRATKRPCGEQ